MKYKKTFLSTGILISLSVPTLSIISCNDDDDKIIFDRRKNVTLKNITESGGLAGNKAKDNNYALIKDFVFSLTNDSGEIFKLLKRYIPNSLSKKEKAEGKKGTFTKIKEFVQGIKSKDWVNMLISFYSKGLNLSKSNDKEYTYMNSIAALIEKITKLKKNKILYFMHLIYQIINSNGIKDVIKKEGGLLEFIKNGSIPFLLFPGLDMLIKNFENGFLSGAKSDYKNYYEYLISSIKNSLKSVITNNEFKEALGVPKESKLKDSFFNVLEQNVFNDKKDDLIRDWKSLLQQNKATKANLKISEQKISDVISRIETNKDKNFSTNIPFFNNKGIFNGNKDKLLKNLEFIQFLIQKFLLYFNYFDPNDPQKKTNVIKEIEKVEKIKDSEIKKFSNGLKSLSINPILWKIASINWEDYIDITYKFINKKFNSTNFSSKEINNLIALKSFLEEKDAKDVKENVKFNNDESKLLINAIINGINKTIINKKTEKIDSKIRKVSVSFISKLLTIINPGFFGSLKDTDKILQRNAVVGLIKDLILGYDTIKKVKKNN